MNKMNKMNKMNTTNILDAEADADADAEANPKAEYVLYKRTHKVRDTTMWFMLDADRYDKQYDKQTSVTMFDREVVARGDRYTLRLMLSLMEDNDD